MTLMPNRVMLLKKLLLDGIDSADALASGLQLAAQQAVPMAMHLGQAEAAAQWLCDLALHYKQVLDQVAQHLAPLADDFQGAAAVQAALAALETVEPGYLDNLYCPPAPAAN